MARQGRPFRRALAAVVLAGLLGGTAGVVHAAFFAGTSNPAGSFSAKRIFPGTRTTSSWTISDVSGGGSGVNWNDRVSFADAVLYETGTWTAVFGATRYLDYDLIAVEPAGLAVSGATLNFRFASTASGGIACFILETRSISSGAVVGTHGTSGSPLGCVTGRTQTTFTRALPEISTTDLANDLRVRIFMREDTGKAVSVDMVSVTGSSPYGAFTLHETVQVDRSTGTAATTRWPVATAGDNVFMETDSSWDGTYNVNEFIQFAVSGHLPAGAVVQGATLTHAYRNTKSGQTCYLVRVFQGTTLIGTYGSTGTPISCSSSTTTWTTDSVPLTDVDTAAEANDLVVRIHAWTTTSGLSQHDLATVGFTYYLD
jgi:hypothetical protein